MARALFIAGLLIPLALFASGARADDGEVDELRAQLRATVLQLRALQDQQASAPPAPAPPDAGTAAKLAAAQARLRAARREAAEAARLRADLDKTRAEAAAGAAQAAASAAETERLKAAYAQAIDTGRSAAAERDALKERLARMTGIATACQAKNDRLVAFARSLIDHDSKTKVLDVLARHEPFLGLARTKLENLTQDRDDAVLADRCDPRLDAGPAGPAAG